MFVICVSIKVKPECVDSFIEATRNNHENTIQEKGNLRFDVIRSQENPNCFMLYEVYYSEADIDSHRETAHYAQWRDTVADMMAEPREAVKFDSVFPGPDTAWETRV